MRLPVNMLRVLAVFTVLVARGVPAARILNPEEFGIIESTPDRLPVEQNPGIEIGGKVFQNVRSFAEDAVKDSTSPEPFKLKPDENSVWLLQPSQPKMNSSQQDIIVLSKVLFPIITSINNLSNTNPSLKNKTAPSTVTNSPSVSDNFTSRNVGTEPSKSPKTSSAVRNRSRLSAMRENYQNELSKSVFKFKAPEEKANSIEDKWRELEKMFRSYTDTVMKKALPKILRVHSQLNISSQCNSAMMQLVSGLRKMKSWAVKMVDASGRLPSGSLEGTLTDLGDYDQCLDVVQPKRNKHTEIRGKYCSVDLKPTLPDLRDSVSLKSKVLDFGNASSDSVLSDLSHGSAFFHFMVMRIGICIPSPCIADDIQEITGALLKKVPVKVSVKNCEVKEELRITVPQFIVMSAAVVTATLILFGTIIDFKISSPTFKSSDIGRVPQSLLAFSLSRNVKQMLKSSRRGSTLGAVNGVRCLSLVWIVLAHTYGFGHRQGLARLSQAKTYMDDIFFQIITNAWVSVDTFFMLGGLLVANSNLKQMESRDGKINFFSYVLHRVLRLTPPVAATLGVMFLLPLIGSGPLWADMVGQKVANCEQRWWQVFLPINTWMDFSSMCLLHTWYIAADMHFYCLAPFALVLLYRWPALGFSVLFMATATCSIVTGILTIINNLPPTVIFFSPDIALTKKTANMIYFRPYPHIGAYCVGLGLGYLIWKYHKWTLTRVTQSIGWVMSSACCLAVLFATYSWSRGDTADTVEGVIYAMLHRTAWSAGVAWVLFVCATGHGGFLNSFLSWSIFTPLSRLCYSVYLLHFPVLWTRASWRRTLLHFHHYDIVTEFLGILMITLCLAVVFHLAFEAPFLKLEQIWFPERKRMTENEKKTDVKQTT